VCDRCRQEACVGWSPRFRIQRPLAHTTGKTGCGLLPPFRDGYRARLGVALLTVLACLGACVDAETERLKETTRPTYDPATGRLKELTYDSNKNGRIETWTEMDGTRPVRARIDRNEDGKLDRWEYYDGKGQLTKVGFSRADDGTPDAWAYPGPDGKVVRVEVSSAKDEKKIDRWERYDPKTADASGTGALVAAEEDVNKDGKPDKWETYEQGSLTSAAFDENHDGKPDRRLTYKDGALVLIETEPDASGGYSRQVPVK
jgi:antitoxin component YwqK of YwqJK toxin-antitoxin module